MKLAILGVDDCTLALARAIVASGEHDLAWVCELDIAGREDLAADLRAVAHAARIASSWEMLLDTALVDGVLVASSPQEDLRSEQLRKLVQSGMPLLVSHPAVESMLLYYELDMIRRDTSCIVMPYLPVRFHPAIAELAEIVGGTDSGLGPIEQILLERPLADRSKPRVLAQFARDVDILRRLCGEVTRVGAMGAASEEAAYAHLGVQMSGPGDILARWSVSPVQAAGAARLSVIGANGQIVVTWPESAGVWTWHETKHGQTTERAFATWDSAATALDRFAQQVNGNAIELDWVDAARSVELAESIQRSLLKGRTVELHYEDYTEEGTFKGTMTSVGCGLLLLGLILMPIVALADHANLHALLWPKLLLALLGLFLGLQLLKLVFPKKD
jgi:myo-inositol 2-dehydrogenase/D-chiro-inositol 1-dehydrogenase